MATYTGVIKAKHATLVAATVDTVTFAGDQTGVELTNLGAADIYFRTDGTAPTSGGDDTTVVRAGESVYTPGRITTVKLISSGAVEYHLEGA